MKPLICQDCRWVLPSPAKTTFMCKASETIDLVTGEPVYQFCSIMRLKDGQCGLEGKLFELNQPDEEMNHGE